MELPHGPFNTLKVNVLFFSYLFFLFLFLFFFPINTGIQLSTEPEVMLDQALTKWQIILKHYAGVVSVAAIGLLLAAIIPVAGVFVCCCRCAGMIFLLPQDARSYRSTQPTPETNFTDKKR